MRKFNPLVFIISSILVGVLTYTSFIAGMAQRGDNLDSFFVKLFAPLFYIFRFPTHTLFNFGRGGGDSLYWIGLLINSIFYGLLIERFFSLSKKKSKIPPVPTGQVGKSEIN
jgi:hypothetical protein